MRRTIPIDRRLDLRATIGGLGMKAAGRAPISDREAWFAGRTPDGPASVRMQLDDGSVEAEAWGPGAAWRLDRLPQLLGLHDDIDDFSPPPGLVYELHRRHLGLRLGSTGSVFEAALPAIIGQRVTGKGAAASFRKIARRWGEPAPGPVPLRLAPEPSALAPLSYEDLHPMGVERSRAQIVIEAARRASRLEEIIDMDRAAAYARLTAVRGIGAWTAAHVMGIAWGDIDAVQVGDYHIPHTVSYALAREPRGDDARMLELLEPYRGQRRRVIMLLKLGGIHEPKFGPRRAIQRIETI